MTNPAHVLVNKPLDTISTQSWKDFANVLRHPLGMVGIDVDRIHELTFKTNPYQIVVTIYKVNDEGLRYLVEEDGERIPAMETLTIDVLI